MSITYNCPHLETPRAPLPPSFASSSSSQHPLDTLFFCEECDAIRCDLCAAVEVASYFCPNCLFDVPSASVRADKNRCARSCFACPQCSTSLQIQATNTAPSTEVLGSSSASTSAAGGPFILTCTCCKWSSKEIGWEFEKSSGLSMQLQKINKQPEQIQSEFDDLKDHLETYITATAPPLSTALPSITLKSASKSKPDPTRHVSHLTQMAAKALHREVPGLAASTARIRTPRTPGSSSILGGREKGSTAWDDLGEYKTKEDWRTYGLERGLSEIDDIRNLEFAGGGNGIANLESIWTDSYHKELWAKSLIPKRIKLQNKLTKRCPQVDCRHLLIQPDSKSTRMKIKMVASNYLPSIEIGMRRRRVMTNTPQVAEGGGDSVEDLERKRRERRRTRGDPGSWDFEDINAPLKAGEVYNYQLAFTNPLYDPIQIRLTQPHHQTKDPKAQDTFQVHIPTPHFTINALKDAWAYDEEDEEGDNMPDMEGATEMTSESGFASTKKSSRLSTLGGSALSSISRESKKDQRREPGVEKKGNISKVVLEVEVLNGAKGDISFDLEVRYTYRAEEPSSEQKDRGRDEYKHFTFWIRVHAGTV